MRFIGTLFFCLAVAGMPTSASADPCPGNPDALGTSRVLTISPSEFSQIGSMQYKQTLPLNDHEVVITFDDGPLPPYTNIILDALASQCVKATYFLVGQMAHTYPSLVRRIYNEGHTIGTHSQDHPLTFQRLPLQRVEYEVDGGIASVDSAIGDQKAVAPFFRIPGLGRSKTADDFLASQQRALQRLEAKGRGILLLHDIHPATAMALPTLLKELKAHGFHVVQVVPAGDRPKSVPELMVSPATAKGAWPTVLISGHSGDVALTTRHYHHIKRLSANKRRPAVVVSVPEKYYTGSPKRL